MYVNNTSHFYYYDTFFPRSLIEGTESTEVLSSRNRREKEDKMMGKKTRWSENRGINSPDLALTRQAHYLVPTLQAN